VGLERDDIADVQTKMRRRGLRWLRDYLPIERLIESPTHEPEPLGSPLDDPSPFLYNDDGNYPI
jgi:hypothetical protein